MVRRSTPASSAISSIVTPLRASMRRMTSCTLPAWEYFFAGLPFCIKPFAFTSSNFFAPHNHQDAAAVGDHIDVIFPAQGNGHTALSARLHPDVIDTFTYRHFHHLIGNMRRSYDRNAFHIGRQVHDGR